MSTNIRIGELWHEDYQAAIRFATEGMHFNWYVPEGPLLRLYGAYFWYQELARATQALAAYVDGKFAGFLLAAARDEVPSHRTVGTVAVSHILTALQELLAHDETDPYDEANREMLDAYRAELARSGSTIDGEILFLAADPHASVHGIGTALLAELERREPGKLFFLYTDTGCTYQFYEHRGFTRQAERTVNLGHGSSHVDLGCFLYSKRFPAASTDTIAGYR